MEKEFIDFYDYEDEYYDEFCEKIVDLKNLLFNCVKEDVKEKIRVLENRNYYLSKVADEYQNVKKDFKVKEAALIREKIEFMKTFKETTLDEIIEKLVDEIFKNENPSINVKAYAMEILHKQIMEGFEKDERVFQFKE
jgi:hypothetical protein